MQIGDLVKPKFSWRKHRVGIILDTEMSKDAVSGRPQLWIYVSWGIESEWDWAEHLTLVAECEE